MGSFCFLFDHLLFSGDTLFYRGVGRTDLKGGEYIIWWISITDSASKMRLSLQRLFKLDYSTVVLCGHYECTTIGYESRFHSIICFKTNIDS